MVRNHVSKTDSDMILSAPFIQDVLGAFDVRYSLVGSPGKRCGGASSAWRIIDDLGHAHQSQSPNRQGHTFSRDSGEL